MEKETPPLPGSTPLLSKRWWESSGIQTGKNSRTVFISSFLILFAVVFLWREIFYRTPDFSSTREVEITKGMSLFDVASVLKEKGVIRSQWFFVLYASLKQDASRMQSGSYSFPPLSLSHIEKNIVSGGAKVSIVIPEGWTTQDIERHLKEKKISSHEKFLVLAESEGRIRFQEKFEFLRELSADADLEGFLFPDTYTSTKIASAEDIIFSFLENFDKKLTREFRQEMIRQGKTVYQIVIMASLIEKEVINDRDRAIVSGILWKRLSLGIPLQVDATIHFVKKQNDLPIGRDGKISLIDTKIDSPYNTYIYLGLPKGPIGNPGLSSLKAAIYPEVSPYLYYLSATDGKTIFSKTLDQHNAAKAEYLK